MAKVCRQNWEQRTSLRPRKTATRITPSVRSFFRRCGGTFAANSKPLARSTISLCTSKSCRGLLFAISALGGIQRPSPLYLKLLSGSPLLQCSGGSMIALKIMQSTMGILVPLAGRKHADANGRDREQRPTIEILPVQATGELRRRGWAKLFRCVQAWAGGANRAAQKASKVLGRR